MNILSKWITSYNKKASDEKLCEWISANKLILKVNIQCRSGNLHKYSFWKAQLLTRSLNNVSRGRPCRGHFPTCIKRIDDNERLYFNVFSHWPLKVFIRFSNYQSIMSSLKFFGLRSSSYYYNRWFFVIIKSKKYLGSCKLTVYVYFPFLCHIDGKDNLFQSK